ncbi:MAG: ParB/RepB/Spo0J family partition protein [Verrucomicrobiota bacterium]|nr:ParB/RepB/Spo0J family partition protein [Verrucomicrobiota bacterium]
MAKPSLGKGLSALIPALAKTPIIPAPPVEVEPVPGEKVYELEIDKIHKNRFQPRRVFKEEEINELASSIKTHGIIQPVVVRKSDTGYELISGERRLRASQSIGAKTVRAIIREASDSQIAELALIENIQRENLNAIEEAEAYQTLIDIFNLRQEDVAGRVGKNRATITNSLRLLSLQSEVRQHVATGHLSVGHAKVLMGLDDAQIQLDAAEKIIKSGLSVRQTEILVSELKRSVARNKDHGKHSELELDTTMTNLIEQIERSFRQKLGTKVQIKHGKDKGSIMIEYYGNDDLNRVLESLGITL